MQNKIKDILLALKICEPKSIYKYFAYVRDRKDIIVLRCKKSGVIFLSKTAHINDKYYKNKDKFSYWSAKSREEAKLMTYDDNTRRAADFKKYISNKKWLDFGTGSGGILDLLKAKAKEVYAVEPQNDSRKVLKKFGYETFASLEDVKINNFDIITLFHVFEHLVDPIDILKKLRDKLTSKGKIIIEVPHANDSLLTTLNLKSFKNFTFWSEHLILHTEKSLRKFIAAAGFKKIKIYGIQRYPLSNHLYWLRYGKPGGHKKWDFLNKTEIIKSYAKLLSSLKSTDTLVAIAEK